MAEDLTKAKLPKSDLPQEQRALPEQLKPSDKETAGSAIPGPETLRVIEEAALRKVFSYPQNGEETQ